jgi:hypothetical protein
MAKMYCPQCGRELDLDSGEVRFCRYCGFSLLDTKEALHGYSEQKRTGFAIVTSSYTLLLILSLLMHGGYVSLDRTRWAFWLFLILIVLSFCFFFAGTLTAFWPARFQSKAKRRDKETLEPHGDSPGALGSAEGHDASSLPPASVPATDLSNQGGRRAKAAEPRSVTEGTTKILNDRSHPG